MGERRDSQQPAVDAEGTVGRRGAGRRPAVKELQTKLVELFTDMIRGKLP